MKLLTYSFVLTVLMTVLPVSSAEERLGEQVLSMQERAKLEDQILAERVTKLIPKLMAKNNIDMWILMSREYNEDPVLKTFLPADWFGARRHTVLVFSNNAEHGFQAYAMARYDVGSIFKNAWDPSQQSDQMKALVELIRKENPNRIGINQSRNFALADGLVSTEHALLKQYLPRDLINKFVSAESLAVGWLETRIKSEEVIYQDMVKLTKDIIHLGFSNEVITPRKTQIRDLQWWFRDKVLELGLQTWFQPTIKIQRQRKTIGVSEDPDLIILPGDLLHVDFGIQYLGLNTDIQQHAYVLKAGEKHAPTFMQNALKEGNKLQDILTNNFVVKRSGNEILSRSREQALRNGMNPKIYSHPIGYYGHSAGTTIGLWDAQHGVAGAGDYPLQHDTAYAIELSVNVYSEEWKKDVVIMLEEDALFTYDQVRYLAPRQEQLILIKHKAY